MKDLKTSLRYLAAALGQPSLEQCPVDAACRDPDHWGAALETHFATLTAKGRTISQGTRRNTRNNLRVLFRQAEAHGLLEAPLPPRLLKKTRRVGWSRQRDDSAPYQTTYRVQTGPRRFGVPQPQWPPDIQEGFRAWRAQCGLRLRAVTFRGYVRALSLYLGYLTNICGRTPTWDDLFDVEQLTAFVLWHAARLERPISAYGRNVVMMIAAMANVLKHPARHALADFRRGLKPATPLHNKREHWVSLATLEAVADSCLAEGRLPLVPDGKVRQHPGSQRAGRFQRGLILKLLVRVPLRSRNIREMQLGTHLAKDTQTGHWHLEFRGEDLKIANRGSQVNTYHINLADYCPEWIPLLVEWLEVHRPKLPNAATSRFVFLTHLGTPYALHSLYYELAVAVGMRTGQRFYPHLLRTIWATEYIEKTRDFTGAAYMLGDTVTTVLKAYQHILGTDQLAKAKDFLGEALRAG